MNNLFDVNKLDEILKEMDKILYHNIDIIKFGSEVRVHMTILAYIMQL